MSLVIIALDGLTCLEPDVVYNFYTPFLSSTVFQLLYHPIYFAPIFTPSFQCTALFAQSSSIVTASVQLPVEVIIPVISTCSQAEGGSVSSPPSEVEEMVACQVSSAFLERIFKRESFAGTAAGAVDVVNLTRPPA